MERNRIVAVLAVVAAGLAACGGDDASSESGTGGDGDSAVHTSEELETITSDLVEAYNDQASGDKLDISVVPRSDLGQLVAEGTPTVLPGASLSDAGVESIEIGRTLAVIAVPEGNPRQVTGVDAFAPAAGLDTAICGAESSFGNFAAVVLRFGGIHDYLGEVGEGCDARVLGSVAAGELDAALVFRAGTDIPDGVELIDIPEDQNLVIDLHFAPADHGDTHDFAEFLGSERATEILTEQGYLP